MSAGTISQGERACWIVHDDRGEYDGEYGGRVTHFDSEAKATTYLEELNRFYGPGGYRVVKSAAPCFTAVAVCDYVYDEAGEGIEHYPDAESLTDALRSADWSMTGDGRWLCSIDADCEVCQPLRYPPEVLPETATAAPQTPAVNGADTSPICAGDSAPASAPDPAPAPFTSPSDLPRPDAMTGNAEDDSNVAARGPGRGPDVAQRWVAPWTVDQVLALNTRQNSGAVHPYTCGADTPHPPLLATGAGWVCTACGYLQNWAHAEVTP